MKIFKTHLLYLLGAAFLFSSCKKGDMGPAGAKGNKGDPGTTGSTGATGAPGDKGDPGTTATVYYSDWMIVDSSRWIQDGAMNVNMHRYYYTPTEYHDHLDSTIKYHVDLPLHRVTQDAIDKGLVYYYYKDSAAIWDRGAVYEYAPGYDLPFGLTNHENGSYYIYDVNCYRISQDEKYPIDKMTFDLKWEGSGVYYDPVVRSRYNPNRIKYNELNPKTKFYIRYVVLSGSISGGRVFKPSIDFKSYEAVKKYYKIPD